MDNVDVQGELEHDGTCVCSQKGQVVKRGVKRLYDEFEPGFPYLNKSTLVCGVNGLQYNSPADAFRAGVKVINCGPCGDCSTVHDVSIYRNFAEPMTRMLTQCALVYLFLGDSSARTCIKNVFALPDKPEAFTPKCLNRFMDNYGCTLTHCYKECVYKWNNPLSSSSNDHGVSHSGEADGTKLNPCMHCDEVYCSPVFIMSGGANRRCSGTVTDVVRPGFEVCPWVDAV